jgi:general L-amino acid transport system substrate-binding protein
MWTRRWVWAQTAGTLCVTFIAVLGAAASASTLDAIKSRGHLRCGVSGSLPGFATPKTGMSWAGFDIDFCRAVAAAIFDDPERIAFVDLTTETKYAALRSGKIDLLARAPIGAPNAGARYGIRFPVVTFFDGQTFLVPKRQGIVAATDLKAPTVCVVEGVIAETNLVAFFERTGKRHLVWTFIAYEDASDAYDEGKCDALSDTTSALAEERALLRRPDDHIILPDTISLEPSGPAIRQGDEQWAAIIRWTHYAMLTAEERGTNRESLGVQKPPASSNVAVQPGAESEPGSHPGSGDDWGVRVIRHIGNYGASFERNLGDSSPHKIARGRNALWNLGGLHYAPPSP